MFLRHHAEKYFALEFRHFSYLLVVKIMINHELIITKLNTNAKELIKKVYDSEKVPVVEEPLFYLSTLSHHVGIEYFKLCELKGSSHMSIF